MEAQVTRSIVRRRLLAAAPGLAVFLVLGLLGTHQTWAQPWLSVGVAMTVSAVFVEPYFASPRSAIVNGAGAAVALLAVSHQAVEVLWFAFLAMAVAVAVSGLIATTAPPSIGTTLAKQIATRLGRAVVLGTAILLLIVLADSVSGDEGFELVAIGTGVLTLSLTLDWANLLAIVRQREELASAVAAIGPRMVLIASETSQLKPGDSVEVRTPRGFVTGNVVSTLPHAAGTRYQVALEDDWELVGTGFPQDISLIRVDAVAQEVIGAVTEGTTQHAIQFEPMRHLDIGSPVTLCHDDQTVLYQVARLRLIRSTWKGAEVVLPQATAHLVGWPEDVRIRGGSHLPQAHEQVLTADDLSGRLEPNYHLVGHIPGTTIPIGIGVANTGGSHVAVLGMSGMGKTVVATRLCEFLAENRPVIALDTTGEYASRLGFSQWTSGDFDSRGRFVHEPQGIPPQKAAEFIEQCMTAGSNEYQAGSPSHRVVVLEEAHTFIPEFPLALREHQSHVAKSTRYVMQSRKFGITFVLVSQRTAVVSKSALSQCENYIILKTLDKTSLEYFESLVGHDVRDAIPGLARYEAVCVGPAFNAEEPVIVKLVDR